MTGPAILGYDYGLLLELVVMGYVENALQKANPYKKTYKFEKKQALLLLILLHVPLSLHLVMKMSTLN